MVSSILTNEVKKIIMVYCYSTFVPEHLYSTSRMRSTAQVVLAFSETNIKTAVHRLTYNRLICCGLLSSTRN